MKRSFTQSFSGAFRSKKSLALRFAAVLGVFALSASQAMAQYLEVPANAMATSNIYKGPSTAFLGTATPDPTLNVQRTAAIYPASEVNAFASNSNITSIGFRLDSAAATAVSGNIKIYLVNTSHTTFARSTTWNTLLAAPTPMTLVYDDSLIIPASKGFYDITLTTPFNYTGGGIYLAFEWEADTATKAVFDAIYRADNTLAGGAKFNIGTSAAKPAVLGQSSAFRPQIRLGGYTPLANDAAVEAVYTLGKLPLTPAVNPHRIEAMIVNKGTGAITNRTVTLRVTGANTYTTTSTIANLASGDTTTVYFTGFTPTNTGTNTVSVTVPADDRTTNDSVSVTQIVTQENISYAVGNPAIADDAVGYPISASFLSRFEVGNNTPIMIPTVRVFIGSGATPASSPIIGKTVFAVVVDENGGLLARSPNKVLTGGDLDGMVDFQITGNPIVQNQNVLVGLAFHANQSDPRYYPVGIQIESAPRDSAFYVLIGDTSFTTPATPQDISYLGFRFMIEAIFADPVGLKDNLLANNAVNVYPNPTSGRVLVKFNNEVKSNTVSFSVMNLQGQVVRRIGSMAVRPVNELNLSDLPAGVYMLQVNTDDATGVQRIVIQ